MSDVFTSRRAAIWELEDDFENALSGSRFVASSSGAGTGPVAVAADASHPGIVEFSTGSTAAGYDGALLGASCVRLGGGELVLRTLVRWPTLSAVAQEYVSRVGLIDLVSGDAVDGVYFEYDRLTSGDVLRCKTAANSVRTATATSTAVVANTWTNIAIRVDAAGANAYFYADGALIATHTTNIPTGAGRETSIGFAIVKSAGGTARLLDVDRVAARLRLTSPR